MWRRTVRELQPLLVEGMVERGRGEHWVDRVVAVAVEVQPLAVQLPVVPCAATANGQALPT